MAKKKKTVRKRRMVPRHLGPEKEMLQDAFLQLFRENGNISQSCRDIDILRTCVYEWINLEEDFKRRFDDAREEAYDWLEAEARRRAVEGVERCHYDKDGNVTSSYRVYSDSLLVILLKATGREKFTDRVHTKVEHEVNHEEVREAVHILLEDQQYVEFAQNKATS